MQRRDAVLRAMRDHPISQRRARVLIGVDPRPAARAGCNRLLTACDWTQGPAAPVDAPAWAAWRQALRDVPQQAGFADVIDWAVAP